MNNKFGELVKAKLDERGWNQSDLARQIDRGRSFVNSLVLGKFAGTRSGAPITHRKTVIKIAAALGIPVDEALTAAGWPPMTEDEIAQQKPDPRKQAPMKNPARSDKHLYDMAVAAALEALKGQTGKPASSAREITIELSNNAEITFRHHHRDLTKDEIERYTLAFRVAYETVK